MMKEKLCKLNEGYDSITNYSPEAERNEELQRV